MRIEYLRLEAADNGFIVCYTEITEKKGSKNTFENCRYDDKKEVFTEDQVDEAVKRLTELAKFLRKKDSSVAPSLKG